MENRTIILSGPICSSMAQTVGTQLEQLSKESKDDIVLMINSFGGCVASMLTIVDWMDKVPNDVVTIVMGKAMSAGAFIALHGTKGKRLAFPDAQFMYHEPNGGAMLTHKGTEHIEHLGAKAAKMCAERAGISVAEFEEMTNRDFYIFADDLLDHRGSFIDGIIGR